jgi:mRNA-degrading endonuclease toxin of MazEF toxin-antitoxin module
MAAPVHRQGELLLAFLVFSDGQGAKRRPVLVVGDFGDDDLLVVPVTSHPARVPSDVALIGWREAGLKFPSTARAGKLSTIAKSCVARKLGTLTPGDLGKVRQELTTVFRQILP